VDLGTQLEEHLHHMIGTEVCKLGALLEVFQGTRKEWGKGNPLGCPRGTAANKYQRKLEQ